MQSNKHIPGTLGDVTAEIALILARGYMRYRRGRRLAPDFGKSVDNVAQVEESEAITEKRLDCSGHRGVRS